MEKGVILLYRMSCDGSLNLHEEAHPDSPGLSRVVSFDRVLGAPGCSSPFFWLLRLPRTFQPLVCAGFQAVENDFGHF